MYNSHTAYYSVDQLLKKQNYYETSLPLHLNFTIACLCVNISANILHLLQGLDSTFGGLEAMITALCDEYPRLLGRHREIFVAVLLIGIYICALPTTTYVSNAIYKQP